MPSSRRSQRAAQSSKQDGQRQLRPEEGDHVAGPETVGGGHERGHKRRGEGSEPDQTRDDGRAGNADGGGRVGMLAIADPDLPEASRPVPVLSCRYRLGDDVLSRHTVSAFAHGVG